MNILVINGSPKGKYSTTLQTVLYIEKHFPQCSFNVINVGQQIRSYEKDFSNAKELIEKSDMLLFAYPVYTFIAPSQLHRFIELLKIAQAGGLDLRGKFASQITTSKHFYDITAHRYIEENCADMGINFIPGLSADMDDLLNEKGQKAAIEYFKHLLWCIENNVYLRANATSGAAIARVTAPRHMPVTVPETKQEAPAGTDKLTALKNVAIVADFAEDDKQLAAMIERLKMQLPCNTNLVNIHDFKFAGGCISCFNCATGGKCVYKDGFEDLLRNEIQKSDAIVIAFSIKDHSMGSIFKTYDDRQFCNGHRTVTMGMPFGYLISGDYSKENNLKMIIDARAEVGGNYLAGVATDEFAPDEEIDSLAKQLVYAIENKYVQPSNFFGVGGMKIFRDLIWLMQGMMKADHKFYKQHKQYDFPQKHRGTMLKMYLVGMLISNPKIKAKMGNKMNEGMIAPYKKVVDGTPSVAEPTDNFNL